ncbi:MAG: hypothetical protein HWD58_10635 [Bacteroidota bacterium]|nr:MAG: hypothetical protein HWD58_10635 [Bacteroidota bacterium]
MYNPYLGDMMAVDNYIKRIKNHTNYQKNDYNICSIYLTHVEDGGINAYFRHNKEIIQQLIGALSETETEATKYFVVFIHAHGYPNDPNNGFSILVDGGENGKLEQKELFNWLAPLIKNGPTFLILNSCFAAEENEPNTKADREICTFENFDEDETFKEFYNEGYPENNFYFLGMSSALVQSNLFNDGTYGLKS